MTLLATSAGFESSVEANSFMPARLAESSTFPLISKLRQKFLDSKIRVGTLRRPRYGVQLIRFVYCVVVFDY